MTTTTTVRDELVADLRTAGGTLRTARAAYEHSPNAEREGWLTDVQARVDDLLDTLLATR
jgi:hypothetical protein